MADKILIIDGYNMIHRCRFSWGGGTAIGDNQIAYNFFRTLKSAIAEFSPDIVYFPLDGKPKQRLEADPTYKANRAIDTTDPETVAYWNYFRSQKRLIIDSLTSDYPIRVLRHKDQECDDLIYYLVKYHHSNDNVVILSSDTDFIQVLNEYPDTVKLYNPISKKYRQNTEYDYVAWKAMVGDKADNISGVKGIGVKTAEKIMRKDGELDRRMKEDSFRVPFEKSYGLIKFIDLKDDEGNIIMSSSDLDMDSIESSFQIMNFESMLNDKYLESYEQVFNQLKR